MAKQFRFVVTTDSAHAHFDNKVRPYGPPIPLVFKIPVLPEVAIDPDVQRTVYVGNVAQGVCIAFEEAAFPRKQRIDYN